MTNEQTTPAIDTPLTPEQKLDRVLDLLDAILDSQDALLDAHNICPSCLLPVDVCPDAEPDAAPSWTDAIDSTAKAN